MRQRNGGHNGLGCVSLRVLAISCPGGIEGSGCLQCKGFRGVDCLRTVEYRDRGVFKEESGGSGVRVVRGKWDEKNKGKS